MGVTRLPTVRAWCSQHPALLAAIALHLAEIGRHAACLVRINDVTKHGTLLPMHRDLPQWLSCYRQHRRLQEEMMSFAGQDTELAAVVTAFSGMVAEMQALPDDGDIRQPAAEACGQRMLAWFFDVHGMGTQPASPSSLDIGDPRFMAWWFQISVQIPCFLLFQETPQRLLRRARHGDLAAIGKLLLVDHNVLLERKRSAARTSEVTTYDR